MAYDKTNTPDEIVDWIDQYDQVISTIDKRTANNNPKYLHRGIAMLLYNRIP